MTAKRIATRRRSFVLEWWKDSERHKVLGSLSELRRRKVFQCVLDLTAPGATIIQRKSNGELNRRQIADRSVVDAALLAFSSEETVQATSLARPVGNPQKIFERAARLGLVIPVKDGARRVGFRRAPGLCLLSSVHGAPTTVKKLTTRILAATYLPSMNRICVRMALHTTEADGVLMDNAFLVDSVGTKMALTEVPPDLDTDLPLISPYQSTLIPQGRHDAVACFIPRGRCLSPPLDESFPSMTASLQCLLTDGSTVPSALAPLKRHLFPKLV